MNMKSNDTSYDTPITQIQQYNIQTVGTATQKNTTITITNSVIKYNG